MLLMAVPAGAFMLMSVEFSREGQLRDHVGRARSPCVSVTTEEHTNPVTRTAPLQGSSVLTDAVKSEGEIRPRLPGSVPTTLSHHTGVTGPVSRCRGRGLPPPSSSGAACTPRWSS